MVLLYTFWLISKALFAASESLMRSMFATLI